MAKLVLGISAFYHDSAAALLCDGQIIAAAQEERFSRIKHDPSFPLKSIQSVLNQVGVSLNDISGIAFYDKPLLKFERLLETYHAFAPWGIRSFLKSMPVWMKEKLFFRKLLNDGLSEIGEFSCPIYFPEHHLSHAASAYYPSPFSEAAILTIDGVGEWTTTCIGHGKDNEIKTLRELHFPHSLGLLYSAFTFYLGFLPNSGEYKLMGLAPYGRKGADETAHFVNLILNNLINLKPDGSMFLNMDYFNFATGLTMTKDRKWEKLFGMPRRKPEEPLQQRHMDLACAIQQVSEKAVVSLARTAKGLTGSNNLVMAGGVALNCVANTSLLRENVFDNIWIQPAAGDAGGAIGAALACYHLVGSRDSKRSRHVMEDVYFGPSFTDTQIECAVSLFGAKFIKLEQANLLKSIASEIANGKIVGWFQGRMEFGPRALGNRSILADPRSMEMQQILNLKTKFREGFRPFAPAILEDDVEHYFEIGVKSPFMLFIDYIKKEKRVAQLGSKQTGWKERLAQSRSELPSVTHLDYSARIQSVNSRTNPLFFQLLKEFKRITGYGVLINTSFNVRGEPIVCNPQDAYKCFLRSGMDILVMGNYVFHKEEQPREWVEKMKSENIKPD
ncbi:MAG: carbamoyltransferase [Cyclobacteriaceae bacterium]